MLKLMMQLCTVLMDPMRWPFTGAKLRLDSLTIGDWVVQGITKTLQVHIEKIFTVSIQTIFAP